MLPVYADEGIGEENMVNSDCKDDLSLEEEIEFTVEFDKDVCNMYVALEKMSLFV